jgi:hypothetical protein
MLELKLATGRGDTLNDEVTESLQPLSDVITSFTL